MPEAGRSSTVLYLQSKDSTAILITAGDGEIKTVRPLSVKRRIMAQKLIICEGSVGEDLLQTAPLASAIADGYEVVSASGYSSKDNRQMCVVLLAEPAETTTTSESENTEGDTPGTEPTE